jgi:hypothetical protein
MLMNSDLSLVMRSTSLSQKTRSFHAPAAWYFTVAATRQSNNCADATRLPRGVSRLLVATGSYQQVAIKREAPRGKHVASLSSSIPPWVAAKREVPRRQGVASRLDKNTSHPAKISYRHSEIPNPAIQNNLKRRHRY